MQQPPNPVVIRLAETIFIYKVGNNPEATWDFQPLAKQSFDAAYVFVDYMNELSGYGHIKSQPQK